ncbi:MAG: ABC transporter permease [Dehalococcoidia bacterium]
MQRYITLRVGQAIVALFGMSLIIFLLVRLTGDPAEVLISDWATLEQREFMRQHLGLDRPLPVQYWIFISGAVQGDFGTSFQLEKPAMEVILERLPATVKLALAATFFSTLFAFPVGILSAVKRDSFFDRVGKVFALLGQSLPLFWLGIILIAVFAVALRLLPAAGIGGPSHYILPAITLGWYYAAGIMRLIRSSMLDVLDSEFIKFARIKGVSERGVVWKHALRNALIPVLTFMSLMFIALMTGSVVTETVFAWPGVGRLFVQAVLLRDFPIVQGIVMLLAFFFVVGNLIIDILYAYIDPRIRYGPR